MGREMYFILSLIKSHWWRLHGAETDELLLQIPNKNVVCILHTFVLPYCTHHVHMQHMCCRRNTAIKHVYCIQKNWNSASHVPHMCIWGMHVCTIKHATCVHSLVCYTCAVACMPLMSCAPFYLYAACLWRVSICVYVAHKHYGIFLHVCLVDVVHVLHVCLVRCVTCAACLPGRCGTCDACLPGRCWYSAVVVELEWVRKWERTQLKRILLPLWEVISKESSTVLMYDAWWYMHWVWITLM